MTITFQFLVVRLEANHPVCYPIPKTDFNSLWCDQKFHCHSISHGYSISIPCGAIRRKLYLFSKRQKPYFNSLWCDQKQVPQLHELLLSYFNSLWCDQKKIYSGVKHLFLKFQFLVVRLEDLKHRLLQRSDHYFNSLWCDQKVNRIQIFRYYLDFNSLWCDQKLQFIHS